MSTATYSLEHVDGMIDFLENKIESGAPLARMLGALQERLDAIEAHFRGDPAFDDYYPHMLELQALIYGESNQEQKALQFMKEAVRQAGGVGRLYSRLIKRYIANHAQPVVVSVASQVEIAAPSVETVEPVVLEKVEVEKSEIETKPTRWYSRLKSDRVMVGLASVLAVGAIVSGALYFVPQVSALPLRLAHYSQIQKAKQQFAALTQQYANCSASLNQERSTINTNNLTAMTNYNNAVRSCENVLTQQHQAASHYNSLIGD